ncbi:GntR family transcriptional regulator [Peterkaempfera griseoplana]|uniref:GntR family transcriptional regulator n=1 Tax=Peterkaempfera griseoplana TaxID=66896 RepID=UPI0006E3F2AC|nr:GntR family transcriptional regulator [Peterkaempfera griseoplana]
MADFEPRHRVFVQERLRDQVARALRGALAAGELEPGALYSAPVLAARYGVSATPVREAMLDLVREGLVETVRNKGFRVTAAGEHDLGEIAEIRALLEVPTALRVLAAAGADRLAALRGPAEEAAAAAAEGDRGGYLDADHRFHRALLAPAGNARLVRLVDDLHRRALLPSPSGAVPDLVAAARDHLELLDLAAAGDLAGAERCLRRHLDRDRGGHGRPAAAEVPGARAENPAIDVGADG